MNEWLIVLIVGHVLCGILIVGEFFADISRSEIKTKQILMTRVTILSGALILFSFGFLSLIVVSILYQFTSKEAKWDWRRPVWKMPRIIKE